MTLFEFCTRYRSRIKRTSIQVWFNIRVLCFPQPKPASQASFPVRMDAASRRTGAVTVMMTAGISRMSLRHAVSLPHVERFEVLPSVFPYFIFAIIILLGFFIIKPPYPSINGFLSNHITVFYLIICFEHAINEYLHWNMIYDLKITWRLNTCIWFLKGFIKMRFCLLCFMYRVELNITMVSRMFHTEICLWLFINGVRIVAFQNKRGCLRSGAVLSWVLSDSPKAFNNNRHAIESPDKTMS